MATDSTKPKTKKPRRGRLLAAPPLLDVRELWVGFTHVCLDWARLADCPRAQIVNQAAQARGYRGQLRVHLCGQYTMLKDWPVICAALKAVESCGDKVEWVVHVQRGGERQPPINL